MYAIATPNAGGKKWHKIEGSLCKRHRTAEKVLDTMSKWRPLAQFKIVTVRRKKA